MGIVNCVRCEESFLRPHAEKNQLCNECYCEVQREINRIDREYKPNKKRRRIENLLKGIPQRCIDSTLAQMAEEVADTNTGNRYFCVGRLKEIEWDKNKISVT